LLDELADACPDPKIGRLVANALKQLFQDDLQLLSADVGERTIAGSLAKHLRPAFPEWNVDVEYNRMGDQAKQIAWDKNPRRVYPDIIVHLRKTKHNLLAIELKKESNTKAKDEDIRKLRAYKTDHELAYEQCLFVRLGIKEHAGMVTEFEWID